MSAYLKGFIHHLSTVIIIMGKYVKFHFKMKWLHPRAGPSSRHVALYIMYITQFWALRELKGPLSLQYILTSADVYESIHHKIITC